MTGALLLTAALAAAPARAGTTPWHELPSGLQARSLDAVPSKELPVEIWLVRLNPALHEVRVVVGRPPGTAAPQAPVFPRVAPVIAEEAHADAVVNASYFDEKGRPLGLLVSRGRTVQGVNASGWAWAAISGGKLLVAEAREHVPDGVVEAVQAGPLLVQAGRARTLSSPRASRRAFIGADGEGRIVLGATNGALTLGALARLLAAPESAGGAGLVSAMNLDGGSTAQLFLAGDDPPLKVAGVPVPVFLAAVPK